MQKKYRRINTTEDTTDTESLIRDADTAKELMKLIAANILNETETFMLAQANISAESAARLFRRNEKSLRL